MSEDLTLRKMTAQDLPRWNEFVNNFSNGSVFHRGEWQAVFENSLGHATYYLLVEAAGEIRGVLPLVHIRSRLFSNLLASLPFLAYGGILASDAEAASMLRKETRTIAKMLRVDFVELRNRQEVPEDGLTKPDYVTFRKPIPDSEEECLKSIPRKQRAMVRKGIGHGLESRLEDDLDNFYPIFSESYRNLGTPVLPRAYFEAINEGLGKDCRILTIFSGDSPVASVMSYYFRDEVVPYYGGSLPVARSLMANDFMYWELMRRGCDAGIKIFDFGRSREGTGSYHFKKHWGFVPEPLHYQYDLIKQSSMPDLSPGNRKYRLAIEIWKRLPTPLTRVLGPFIARGLPG